MEIRLLKVAELRMEGGDANTPPKLVGYGAVFNSLSDPLPHKAPKRGTFKEVVRPGAFTRCLANNPDISLLINHDGLPLGNTRSGTLKCTEDARGLRFETELDPTDPDVQRLIPKMKRGDLKACSFAFNTRSDDWRVEPQHGDIRELHDVDCSDVSIVNTPAYPAASASLRSLEAAWESRSKWEAEHQEVVVEEVKQTPADVLLVQLDLLELD